MKLRRRDFWNQIRVVLDVLGMHCTVVSWEQSTGGPDHRGLWSQVLHIRTVHWRRHGSLLCGRADVVPGWSAETRLVAADGATRRSVSLHRRSEVRADIDRTGAWHVWVKVSGSMGVFVPVRKGLEPRGRLFQVRDMSVQEQPPVRGTIVVSSFDELRGEAVCIS